MRQFIRHEKKFENAASSTNFQVDAHNIIQSTNLNSEISRPIC